jgi:hypothetical protein
LQFFIWNFFKISLEYFFFALHDFHSQKKNSWDQGQSFQKLALYSTWILQLALYCFSSLRDHQHRVIL